MSGIGRPVVAPVVPTPSARVALRPVGLAASLIDGGLWAERRRVNRGVTIPHGAAQLEVWGNLENFRLAALGRGGQYRGGTDDSGRPFAFLDSDVYKWLEAVGWELASGPDAALLALAEPLIELVERAQRSDGYVNTFVQLTRAGAPYADMEWGHELYCLGHLVQAGIAWQRAAGDDRLLSVAVAAVGHAERELGPGGRQLIDGHPGIEMALVELYRLTGEARYLEFARALVERRGHGLLGRGRFGPDYWQDATPVRLAAAPIGHAVRQVYLDCGVVDVAVETGDDELLASAVRRWEAMVASRTYLTGGLGSRHLGESFGDPYELPPDRAHAETCAAIGSVMLAHRLHLATGDHRYADHVERTALNAVLAGLSLDGSHFFYSNPLQRRTTAAGVHEGPMANGRAAWFACACCPPNVMRFLATVPDLLVTVDGTTLHVGQFASGPVRAQVGGSPVALRVETDYPWSGAVSIRVEATTGPDWELALRVPAWCEGAELARNASAPVAVASGEVRLRGPWRAGDAVELRLAMPARVTVPDPLIDAVRGTVAVEQGPVVYALESDDLPPGTELEGAMIEGIEKPAEVGGAGSVDRGGLPTVGLRLLEREPGAAAPWPYYTASGERSRSSRAARTLHGSAIPYFAWGNRSPLGMRVWIPVSSTGCHGAVRGSDTGDERSRRGQLPPSEAPCPETRGRPRPAADPG